MAKRAQIWWETAEETDKMQFTLKFNGFIYSYFDNVTIQNKHCKTSLIFVINCNETKEKIHAYV